MTFTRFGRGERRAENENRFRPGRDEHQNARLFSPQGAVSAEQAAFRKNKLKQFEAASTKRSGATQQVKAPHPKKSLAMAIFKLRPRTAHICFPGHQRAVV